MIGELATYVELDRAVVIEEAREAGRYRRLRRPFVVEDPDRPVAKRAGGHRIKVSQLNRDERRELFIDGPDGLEPAVFWLSEYGWPMAVPTWKDLFGQANARCHRQSLELAAHAHALRHTFAVITLEQLQRGHIAKLAELTPEQRDQWTKVFGDPLDWVRQRLGHRSVTTTQIYLHCLAELEMETRMELVPDDWEDPRDAALCDSDDAVPEGT